MNKQSLITSIVAVFTASASCVAVAHNPPTPAGMEKCYGIAKAHKNQCGTKTHSCATLSKKDNDPASWVFVKKNTCLGKGGKTAPPEGNPES